MERRDPGRWISLVTAHTEHNSATVPPAQQAEAVHPPQVRAFHYGSKSRPIHLETEAVYVQAIKAKWGLELLNDRFHNPNLALDNEQFSGYRPFPVQMPPYVPNRLRKMGGLHGGAKYIAGDPAPKSAQAHESREVYQSQKKAA